MTRNRSTFFGRGAIVVFALAAGALGGCARANELHGSIAGLRDLTDQAERNGAMACAPRELAIARANLRFAESELSQGNLHQAEEHFAVAEPNARAAFAMSPAERCSPEAAPPVEPPPVEPPPVEPPPPPQPVDSDGDGYLDPNDACPREPEDFDAVEDADGCPEDQDSDGDGHMDSRDLCTADPEDVDGNLDTDGCPEPDNDADGILDAADRCANDAEDVDGFSDEDGCPDNDNDTDSIVDVDDACPNEAGPASNQGCPRVYRDVEVTGTHVVIRQTIQFEFNRAVIRPVSFPILNTVAQVLRDFPTITVEVQGHTDDRGNDDYNFNLSTERATAVRNYLMAQGIEASRMTSAGYGETRPIAPNRTGAGRAQNRRVEFVRTDAASAPVEPAR